MLDKLKKILEMIRFSHTVFALPFALLAAVMAWSIPTASGDRVSFQVLQLVGILLCMVFARSSAMAFNRIVDRKIDAENPRTKNRHIPSGQLSLQSVVVFTLVTGIGFIASTLIFWPNWLPFAFSVPVLGVLFGMFFVPRLCAYSFLLFWCRTDSHER